MLALSFQFARYGLVSVFGYGFQFVGTYFFTEIVGLEANISYLITITLAYGILYLLHAKFIFLKKPTSANFKRYIVYVIIFWLLNNLLFNYIFYYFDIHYFVIITINIVLFVPARFLVSRNWVFRN